jgi:protein-L-isoaspartate(D-aspartate) O-methyltransferase
VDEHDLHIVRRAYARQLVGLLGVEDERLENAFAAVPRERFLGSKPWHIRQFPGGSVPLPTNDPVYVYQNVLIALDPKRGVNNGSPSLHARMMQALGPKPGDVVAHIGAGSGYYSAILAELVRPEGSIISVEFDQALAEQARATLSAWPNVEVVHGDGATWPKAAVDGIYVNFAVGRPASPWMDNLLPGGRLVFPLGVSDDLKRPGPQFAKGVVLRVEKALGPHPASVVGPASFVFAEGEAFQQEPGLAEAFKGGGIEAVRSLAWGQPTDARKCWYLGDGWALLNEAP